MSFIVAWYFKTVIPKVVGLSLTVLCNPANPNIANVFYEVATNLLDLKTASADTLSYGLVGVCIFEPARGWQYGKKRDRKSVSCWNCKIPSPTQFYEPSTATFGINTTSAKTLEYILSADTILELSRERQHGGYHDRGTTP
jgi:hypothetical protein